MKKFLASLLVIVIVLSTTVPVTAYEYNDYNGYNGYNMYNGYDNGYENDNQYNNYVSTTPIYATTNGTALGYIGEITKNGDCYEVKILGERDETKIVLLVPTVNAVILDSTTGQPAKLENHGGKQVHVTYNLQTYKALVVSLNIEYMNIPNLHTIEAINHYNDSVLLTVDNGTLVVRINEETELHAWLTRHIVTKEEFQIGDKVLLWYPVMAMSYPAQATANRALRLIPVGQEAEITEPPYYAEYDDEVPNVDLNLKGEIVRVGVRLYPVRINAVEAGFDVSWNTQQRRAELTKNGITVTLAPNFATFYVNDVEHTMTIPSLLENGRLYAPASFFDKL